MPSFQPLEMQLTDRVRAAVATLSPDAPLDRVTVERSKAGRGSDFQCAAAMQLTKILKRNPRQIAQDIVDALELDGLAVPDIAGPGFIGFTATPDALQRQYAAQIADARLGAPESDGSTIVIDFSSPNVAKRMHIGHIRSTIIGDALRRFGLRSG